VGSRRHSESLPYFRRMIELLPPDDWSLRHDYANALQGASLESRTLHGLPLHAARSSYESIALMREALAELDRAQRLAPTPRAAAAVHLRARASSRRGGCRATRGPRRARRRAPIPHGSWRRWRRASGRGASRAGLLAPRRRRQCHSAATRLPDRGGRK
jgi:hypothetical protein